MKSLEFLIGDWITHGLIKGENRGEEKVSGTDSYEWILDQNFILHEVDVTINNQLVQVFEIIGKNKTGFDLRSFDNEGGFSEMSGRLDDKKVLHITGDKMRAVLSIIDPNTLKAHWEKSPDNKTWEPWMDIILERASPKKSG